MLVRSSGTVCNAVHTRRLLACRRCQIAGKPGCRRALDITMGGPRIRPMLDEQTVQNLTSGSSPELATDGWAASRGCELGPAEIVETRCRCGCCKNVRASRLKHPRAGKTCSGDAVAIGGLIWKRHIDVTEGNGKRDASSMHQTHDSRRRPPASVLQTPSKVRYEPAN